MIPLPAHPVPAIFGEQGAADAVMVQRDDFARTDVVFRLPRSPTVQVCEDRDTTVISGAPDSEMAGLYRQLAQTIYSRSEDISGGLRLDYAGCNGCE